MAGGVQGDKLMGRPEFVHDWGIGIQDGIACTGRLEACLIIIMQKERILHCTGILIMMNYLLANIGINIYILHIIFFHLKNLTGLFLFKSFLKVSFF